MMNLTVIKRDGSKEAFTLEKIHRVVSAAGLPEDKAHTLLANISDWAQGLTDKEVSSLNIRDEVLKELKKADEYSANMFSWYQKTKDKKH